MSEQITTAAPEQTPNVAPHAPESGQTPNVGNEQAQPYFQTGDEGQAADPATRMQPSGNNLTEADLVAKRSELSPEDYQAFLLQQQQTPSAPEQEPHEQQGQGQQQQEAPPQQPQPTPDKTKQIRLNPREQEVLFALRKDQEHFDRLHTAIKAQQPGASEAETRALAEKALEQIKATATDEGGEAAPSAVDQAKKAYDDAQKAKADLRQKLTDLERSDETDFEEVDKVRRALDKAIDDAQDLGLKLAQEQAYERFQAEQQTNQNVDARYNAVLDKAEAEGFNLDQVHDAISEEAMRMQSSDDPNDAYILDAPDPYPLIWARVKSSLSPRNAAPSSQKPQTTPPATPPHTPPIAPGSASTATKAGHQTGGLSAAERMQLLEQARDPRYSPDQRKEFNDMALRG